MQNMTGREWFDSSASALTALLPATRNHLDAPGLGEWDVRSLLGHTCRAFTTVEKYLSAGAESPTRQPDVDSPADYYRGASAMLADPHQVELRGKDAGRELGDDPAAAAETIAQRVCDLVARTPGHAIVITPVGAMRLDDYLPSRAFELTVHGLDLALATGQPIPERLQQNIGNAITLCSQIATAEQAVQLLRGITGRDRLPPDFTVI